MFTLKALYIPLLQSKIIYTKMARKYKIIKFQNVFFFLVRMCAFHLHKNNHSFLHRQIEEEKKREKKGSNPLEQITLPFFVCFFFDLIKYIQKKYNVILDTTGVKLPPRELYHRNFSLLLFFFPPLLRPPCSSIALSLSPFLSLLPHTHALFFFFHPRPLFIASTSFTETR